MTTKTDPQTDALIRELYRTEEKAEIVGGKVVKMVGTGFRPGWAGDEVYASLRAYAKRRGGVAVSDGRVFLCDLPDRKSFSPDAAYYTGPLPEGLKFFDRTPVFAVEVRSGNDYGPSAERRLAAKRDDYFAAGTRVVWDVDLLGEDVVRVYRLEAPGTPTVYRRGERAEAEPAVPGWTIAVDDLFAPDPQDRED